MDDVKLSINMHADTFCTCLNTQRKHQPSADTVTMISTSHDDKSQSARNLNPGGTRGDLWGSLCTSTRLFYQCGLRNLLVKKVDGTWKNLKFCSKNQYDFNGIVLSGVY